MPTVGTKRTTLPQVTMGVKLFPCLLLSHMVCFSLADIHSSLVSPSFVKLPEDQTGSSGGSGSFVCQATGEPKPTITWMKGDEIIGTAQRTLVKAFDEGSGSVLRIYPLRTQHAGLYKCMATNSAGEISTAVRLTVLEEDQTPPGFPTIAMGPHVHSVNLNHTAQILCTVSGNPEPEISWYKDLQPLDISGSNGRIKTLSLTSEGQFHTWALQIENSEEADEGMYECVAKNTAGSRFSLATSLYVRVRRTPPFFTSIPPDREVMLGGSVNLTCRALGEPVPYVRWMKNAEDLNRGEVNPLGENVLELRDIRESVNYTCVAMSHLGSVKAVVQLTVKASPSFIKSPEDQTGVSGEVASFVCRASGKPTPRITWKKNGKEIVSTHTEVIEFDNGSGSVLRIQDMNKEADEGLYECKATNSMGSIIINAKLTVLKEDQVPLGFPTIDVGPELRVVDESRSTSLSCAVSGNPDPVIVWYKDKLPLDISSSNGRFQHGSGALQIENSEKSDQGIYECVAMNRGGTRFSAPANLFVREHWAVRRSPPRISLPPTNQEVSLGGSVNLTCAAQGTPKPYVKWMRGTEELTPEEEMPVGINVLELTNIRESAVYTCVALSSLGRNEEQAEVRVKGQSFSKPSFIKSPEDQTGVSGRVASFVCHATGEPKPSITWKKNGKKLNQQTSEVIMFDGDSGSVLRIERIRMNRDDKDYECTATNSAGQISTSAKLTVLRENQLPHGFPTINRGPELRVVEVNRTAFMSCVTSGNPNPEISWYKDMLPLDIDSSNGRINQLSSGSLQIHNSEESDQGKYECAARNSHGTIFSYPANLYVRVLREVRRVPPRFAVPPMDQEVMQGASVDLTCVAVGSPMPYVKWMRGTEELTPEEEIPMGRNILALTNIRESANYTCVAGSTLGLIHATAQVTVKGLPIRPTALAVTKTTPTSVALTWDYEDDEPLSYYMIQYRDKTSHSFLKVRHVLTLHYSIRSLRPNTKYEFRVAAVNEFGQGPFSDPVEIQTGEQAPSSPPRNVRVSISKSFIFVQWKRIEEPDIQVVGYRVYYNTDQSAPLSEWKQINTTSDNVFIWGLNFNTNYSLRVLGFSSGGDGPLSDVQQMKTQVGEITPPLIVEVEALNSTFILVTWKPPQMVQGQLRGYRVIYSHLVNGKPQDSIYTLTFPVGAQEAVIGGLQSGATYSVRVSAFTNMGYGSPSQPKVITTTGAASVPV